MNDTGRLVVVVVVASAAWLRDSCWARWRGSCWRGTNATEMRICDAGNWNRYDEIFTIVILNTVPVA